MKPIKYIYLLALAALWACSNDAPLTEPTRDDDIYLTVNLDAPSSRLSYEFTDGSGLDASGNIKASWELGDIIKVYETGVYAPSPEEASTYCYSDVYADYDAYKAAHPYPAAPTPDTYYRFVCVGGEGTPQGVFKYIGLATATVVEIDGVRTVNVAIKYNHAIKDWKRFQGLVIYGNPLRNLMMRTQVAKNDLSHLKFGERMYGYVCAHNFQLWFQRPGQTEDEAGIDRVVLRNVGGCIYRVIIGGVDVDIYGGSTLSLEIPGVTDQDGLLGSPMTLTLGSADELQLGFAPWSIGSDPNDTFCTYLVGWPGTVPANATTTVTLKEHVSGNIYTWELSKPEAITFEEGLYYTIDLRDYEYTKTK